MLNRLSRVFLASVLLGALAAAPAMAQNGRGQGKGPDLPDSASSGAGVPQAGETVVLRPSGPVPDQYIVVLRDDVTNPRGLANALARQNGLALRGVYTRALKGFAARMPEAVAQRLALDPAVAYVEQDLYAQADVLVTGVDRIDADENAVANIDNTDGATSGERVDVDVAVIDTGIDGQHGDLDVHALFNCIG
ncbi:MAG TPA: protease inhibitor I9 family protein, partial [Kiloniellales bacterium]|nr:protease inhibitor I9 family protein [Kiloniellales bacterium]